MKISFKMAAATMFAAIALLASCSKPEANQEEDWTAHKFLVLNNGNWGSNDASIGYFSLESGVCSGGQFQAANGKKLGDLGQDIMRMDEQIYIAVNGSQVVFVTDSDLKITHEITAKADGATLSPRYFTNDGKYVYVTYYEGYLGRIDPSDWTVTTTKVGPNPEGLAYSGGNIYVANSGGYLYPTYNNTVSVVSASSFKETSTVTVSTNPCTVRACGSDIYVFSLGNYGDIAAKVEKFSTGNTSKVTDLGFSSPSAIDTDSDYLYVMCGGYDASWNPLPGSVYRYKLSDGTMESTAIITGIPNAYSFSVAGKYIFAGSSDYKTTGDVSCYSKDGTLLKTFDSQGLNPLKVLE